MHEKSLANWLIKMLVDEQFGVPYEKNSMSVAEIHNFVIFDIVRACALESKLGASTCVFIDQTRLSLTASSALCSHLHIGDPISGLERHRGRQVLLYFHSHCKFYLGDLVGGVDALDVGLVLQDFDRRAHVEGGHG